MSKTIRRYFSNMNFLIGFILVFFLFILLIVSFFYMPYGPTEMDTLHMLEAPSKNHWFGTDNLGRDILSRVMQGTQAAFYTGTLAVAICLAVGVLLGAVAGYYGGRIDSVIMHIIDAQMAFPGLLLALMLVAVFGTGLRNTVIALGIMGIPKFTRITRSGFLQYKEMEFVKAAKMKGASSFRIMFIHIMPNIVSSLIVACSLAFAGAILSEAGLSYLGLGIQPPDASWGRMLKDASSYMYVAPWTIIAPGAIISILVLGFNLLGDGLRDLLDTRN